MSSQREAMSGREWRKKQREIRSDLMTPFFRLSIVAACLWVALFLLEIASFIGGEARGLVWVVASPFAVIAAWHQWKVPRK